MPRITFVGLPIPPSRNEVEGFAHPIQKGKAKNAWRRRFWCAAIQQNKPRHDPPAMVHMRILFHLKREHDVDGLDLKWLLDSLGKKQLSGWRQGIADTKGFYVDDSPNHLTWDKPIQRVIPEGERPRVDLILEWDE